MLAIEFEIMHDLILLYMHVPWWKRVRIDYLTLERVEGAGKLSETLTGLLQGLDVMDRYGRHVCRSSALKLSDREWCAEKYRDETNLRIRVVLASLALSPFEDNSNSKAGTDCFPISTIYPRWRMIRTPM